MYLELLILGSTFCDINSYKILAILPMPSYSHYILHEKILLELVRRGHEVTAINPYPQKSPVVNFTDISVASISKPIREKKQDFYRWHYLTPPQQMRQIFHFGLFLTELTLQHENVQNLLHSDKTFDLLIIAQFFGDAFMAFQNKFKPIVLISPLPQYTSSSIITSFPNNPSYIPNVLTSFTGKMTFWQRFLNTYYDLHEILYYQWIILPQHRELVRKYIPGRPDLHDFLYNASLVLINAHLSISNAVPRTPHIIDIGGIHIEAEKRKATPNDLKFFLDNSTNGVILFSMGSNLKSSELPDKSRQAILKAFSKLRQNVIWKWEKDNLPGLPPNVKVMKWVPQSNILAHPNTVAFITHGGLQSTMESIYYGIPFIGIPVYADQKANIAKAVLNGYAEEVSLERINEESLIAAIKRVIHESKYRENVKKRSMILRDKPRKSLDEAIFWIEYVVRHKGAPYLKYAGAELTWYQRCLLDVAIVAVLILIFAAVVIKIIVMKLFKKYLFIKVKKN